MKIEITQVFRISNTLSDSFNVKDKHEAIELRSKCTHSPKHHFLSGGRLSNHVAYCQYCTMAFDHEFDIDMILQDLATHEGDWIDYLMERREIVENTRLLNIQYLEAMFNADSLYLEDYRGKELIKPIFINSANYKLKYVDKIEKSIW